MNHRLATVLIGGLTIAGGLSACHGGPHPTFTVDSGLDISDAVPGDGICDAGTGICTLRAAIDESNTLAGDDTATIELTVDVDLTIPGTLDNTNTTGDLDITHTVLINGQGHTIDAHQLDRVIDHHTGDLTITDTTITGGDATDQGTTGRGGGLNIRDGNTIITDTTITNNTSDKGGGGISHRNAGNLDIYTSAITYNSDLSPNSEAGGGVDSADAMGEITIQHTTIDHNSSTGGDGGVTINDNFGHVSPVYIADSSISNNIGEWTGGLRLSFVDATIERTVIEDNASSIFAAFDHFGGGEFVLVDSVVSGNTSTEFALAIIGANDGFDILRSTFIDNNVVANGLIMVFEPPEPGLGRPPGPGSIRQSTITGTAPDGMLWVLRSSTDDVHLSLGQTVVQNSAGATCGTDPDGPYEVDLPVSLGHNWTSDTTCGLSEPTDTVGSDPMLGPLQDNGGPTQTMLPLTGSPLLNAIAWNTANACDPTTPTDQRGLPRPAVATTNCDIGAAERQPTDP